MPFRVRHGRGFPTDVVKRQLLVKQTEYSRVLKRPSGWRQADVLWAGGRGSAEHFESGRKNAVCGRRRSVCALTIPQHQDIKDKLSVPCKRWRRQKPVVYVGGGAISAAAMRRCATSLKRFNRGGLFINGTGRVSCYSSPVVRNAGNTAWRFIVYDDRT